MAFLKPGETCWRVEHADRAAFLVDAQEYFTAAYDVLLKAERQIILLGWSFNPKTRLAPDGGKGEREPDMIGRVLLKLSKARPDLDIHVLIWASALPISASQQFFPHRARPWFRNSRIRFWLDDQVPFGACHHQKVLVVDDAVAFVGGGDFCNDRWDSTAHLDVDNRRIVGEDHDCHAPRHEVTMMVDGDAARALGEHARVRWRRALTRMGEIRPARPAAGDLWPDFVRPDLEDVQIGIARTEPAWRGAPPVHEIRNLTYRSISGAKDLMYLENQYLTSPLYAEAMAARVNEPKGPEIVLMSTEHSPSWFDRLTMDRTRALFMRRVRESDVFSRFSAYCPETAGGETIIVHAKVSIIDDDLVRVGSSNMNNRSAGFDTELEIAAEARTEAHQRGIRAFRHRLVGHYIVRSADDVAQAVEAQGSLRRAMESLNRRHRFRSIHPEKLHRFEQLIAEYHMGDPTGVSDSMRPWRRRDRLHRQIRELAANSKAIPSDT